jgi:hypothetical protein
MWPLQTGIFLFKVYISREQSSCMVSYSVFVALMSICYLENNIR